MKSSKLILSLVAFTFLILQSNTLLSQDNNTGTKENIDDYKHDTIKSDFELVFNANDDKVNFKKLRSYLQRKEDIAAAIQAEMTYYSDIQRNLDLISEKDREIDGVLENAKENKLTEGSIDIYIPNCNINIYASQKMTLSALTDLKKKLSACSETEMKRKKELMLLKLNLKEIKTDISLCQDQIDTTLAPEYQGQEFRKAISIGFACLIGVLLMVFVLVIFRSKKNIADYFFSDTGLQFMTIFVLIIAIILFGILGILEGKELAAILAGISGYILGKSKSAPIVEHQEVMITKNNGNTTKKDPVKPEEKPKTTDEV